MSCWQSVYGLVVADNLWFLVSHYTDMKFACKTENFVMINCEFSLPRPIATLAS